MRTASAAVSATLEGRILEVFGPESKANASACDLLDPPPLSKLLVAKGAGEVLMVDARGTWWRYLVDAL